MKSVLITGGAARIGKALSKFFATNGWKVHVHYNSSEKSAIRLQKYINEKNGEIRIIKCDLGNIDEIKEKFLPVFLDEKIDLLINNASIFEYDSPDSMETEIFLKSMRVNILAPTKISEIYYNSTLDQPKDKCIINILDNKVFSLNPDFYSYTLAKSALLSATKMQAMSFAPSMRVCGIAPSVTLPSGAQTQTDFQISHPLTLTRKGCSPEDICKGAYYIANNPIYNGQVLVLDGGQSLTNLSRDVAFLDE
ncbi:SDR family NAD(P)-dependent oxidoreductase [Thalassospira lucentensis]|uniref:SDR family NAD(P)-dependent oxidoreductase n=1 Tax=Thalassospira lucentensis TaxID=168935 RepID=UPI00142D6FF7|nr:SDR family NAD(P)-dependent oxidoreductase [Thalassospira lucentensis]NIZ00341.1 SDR family NAD(P)-dependent oxidoreductase [Thalassospira lucentensis]